MTKLERFFFSLIFALLLAGVTMVIGLAKSDQVGAAIPEGHRDGVSLSKGAAQNTAPAQQPPECSICHPKFQDSWLMGAHGRATSDPIFDQAWTKQGKPGACLVCHVTGYDPATATWQKDGVACEACHSPVPADHFTNPGANPAPVDRSPNLCGHCHSGAHFGWEEWQASAHYQRNMACTVCHDAHSASLKTIISEADNTQGTSALCINCHREVSMNFPYSKHNQAGISCVDCHLRHFEEKGSEEAHTMPDHSFNASLATCNACHADQMHSSTETVAVPAAETPTPELTTGKSPSGAPSPVSPFGFAGLAGLLGLAGGMVLSPWLEKLYRRLNTNGRQE